MNGTCPYCHEPARIDVLEAWSDHQFQLDCCCESMHADAVAYLNEADPRTAGQWLAGLSDGILELVGQAGVRRVIEDGACLLLDWNLSVVPVSLCEAKAFVRAHHRHNAPPPGWRFGAGVRNGRTLIGVVMVGRPVARLLDHRTVLEVNRLCIRNDIAPGLAWNACSLLYGWASRQAQKRSFTRLITYTLSSESGTTLRAAGWLPEHTTQGGSWNRRSRPRTDSAPTEPKVRWAPRWCAAPQQIGLAGA